MRIGVVVHGPNIIDSGYALKLIELLKDYGEVKARLGGTMGRTAVIDASLENVIDISKKLVPSDSLKIFHDENVDVIFLLNYGKSDVTGQVFGYKVYNHYVEKIDDNNVYFRKHYPIKLQYIKKIYKVNLWLKFLKMKKLMI